MEFFTCEDGALVCRTRSETVRIKPWGKDSFRVQSVIFGDVGDESVALLPPEKTEAVFEIEDDKAKITNGAITAVCSCGNHTRFLHITFLDANGNVLLSELPVSGALIKRAREFKPLQGGNFHLKMTFESDPKEKIYGMGQYQQEIFDLKGCNLELAHRNTQVSVPFYLSSKGYGFLWHNAAVGEVHFGLNTTEWVAESTDRLDYWITAGKTPAAIEANYSRAVGRAPMMPEYGLGYWQCKLRYYNEEQVLEVAREYKRKKIPLDVIVIDYYHWPRCGDWRFDREYFPNAEKMVRELKEMGIECMVSVWPQVDQRSENYEELRHKGLLVKTNTGMEVQMVFHGNNLFIDPTNLRTRRYVWDKISQNYYDMGIRTFWLDCAEPEFGTYDYDNYRYYAGTVLETGNIYPREYARLFYEGLRSEGEELPVSLIRCAWVGSQRYGALVWSGDIKSSYEDFRRQICAGLHMGIAGIPWWTTDIGGFNDGNVNDPDFQELLIRWFQFGAFSPVMRMHGSRLPHTPVVNKAGEVRERTGAPNEVWSFGEENEAIMVKFIGIRELLRDYTRRTMTEAHTTGAPVMRPLFYEFPDDGTAWDIKDSYLFGSDILVSPIVEKHAFSRKVYLPAGADWTDARTGKTFAGGQWVECEAPIDTLPVFVRDGKVPEIIGKI